MSNINIEDVNLRLTETRNELSEEDSRLWDGLENERLARNAGDDANKSLTLQVQDAVSSTERRLSTEVIHREQGDLDKLGVLNQLSQSMSDYRIKTDKEIEAERFARDILGINLDARITTTEASFNHRELKLYQGIQEVFTNLDGRYSSMDARIKKYEDMLQDITMDSIRITMDNGDINMGAWTILSQAREWDLEILAKMRGFQEKTTEDVNQALEEFQNGLPITENIINEIMDVISNSSLINELHDALNETQSSTDLLRDKLVQESIDRANAIVDLAYVNAQALLEEKRNLAVAIEAEAQERIDTLAREREARLALIEELENGFTEKFELIEEGQSTTLTEFNNYKVSTDESLANFNTSINLISDDVASQGSVIDALDLRLKGAEDTAASAVTKSEAALTATSAQAEIINGLSASLADKADASALNILGTEIQDLDGKVSLNTSSLTQLQGNLDNVNTELSTKASLTALNSLSGNVETIGNQTIVNTDAVTNLKNRVDVVEGAVSTKLDASVIANYYTKGQADDKSAEIAAGKIESYNANLVIGGANLLTETKTFNKAGTVESSKTTLRPNYVGFGSAFITDPDSMLWRTHTVVQVRRDWCGFYYSCNSDNPADWFADQDMTLSVWVLNNSNADVTAYGIVPALGLVATISGGGWQRIVLHIEKGRALRNSSNQGIIEFNFASTEGAFYYAAPMLQYGNAVTAWQPSAEEVQNALDANASVIQSTAADVSRIDGVVTSQASSISSLQSSLSDVDTKANAAINNAATAQQTANTAVTAVEANAGIITRLESSLASGVGTRNYLLNSAEVGTAKVISEDFNFMELEIGDVIQMSFDIDITSPVSAGSRNRIGYELGILAEDGNYSYLGVWLTDVSNKGVYKGRVYSTHKITTKLLDNPKNFPYYAQIEGGAFTVKNVQLTVSKIPVATWSAAPEDLATASALNNYYTKTQVDDKALTIAAGEVSKYDANLVIGGTNLLLNSDFSAAASSDRWMDNGGGYTKVNDPIYGDVLQTSLPAGGLVHAWLKLENNVEYTYSALVKPSNDLYMTGNTPLHYWAGKDNQHQGKIHVLSYSPTLIEAGKWTRINIVFKLVDDADSFRPFIFGLGGALQLAWTKLERGNKATDWSPNSVEMQDSINANASAVQSTKAEVLRIDGVVSSQASQIVTLESSKSAIENGGIAGNDEYIVDLRDPAYNRDLYYPVLLSNFSTEYRQTIRVTSTLDGVSVPPWASHGGGFSLNAQFQMGGAGWGTIDPEIVTDNFIQFWTHGGIPPLDQIDHIGSSSQPFFYVRGGGYYRLSKPVNRSVQVCAPNGSLSGYFEGTLYPRPYQESTVPKSINQGLNQQNVKLQQTNTVLDGVKAVSTVTVDNNGVMSGYGLISELANGQVRSSFGVNADTFFIGAPASNKKPFIVTSYPQDINGVSYPAGTWIDVALIANATIGTAKIADLAVTGAKIANATIDNAKIANIHGNKIFANTIVGDHIVGGTIEASKLSADAINTISLNARNGTFTAADGSRTIINGGLTQVLYPNGIVAVKLGVW